MRLIDADALKAHYAWWKSGTRKYSLEGMRVIFDSIIDEQPTVESYNRHEVASIIADLFGDDCACNFNGIDEWLWKYCDFADDECPNPVGVACWEQYLKHRGKNDAAN